MNTVGTKIEPFKIGQRDFDPIEIINTLRRLQKVWSWGAHAWRTIDKTKGFRFATQGHHHKGHVYVILAWNDTFTIYFTSRQGKIKDVKTDIYIDMLVDTIDRYVEYIPEYGDN
jgi:hypothetical protein